VPDVMAADGRRLLTRDAGRRLRNLHDEGVPAPGWEELLVLYAELQIDFMTASAEALSLGTPDRSPALLAGLAAELSGWRGAVEPLRRAADGLGDTVPLTVVHEEATDGNVFVRDGLARLVDWGEASVTHPFVGGLLPLRVATERSGGAERLRDIYLEPYTRFEPLTELRTAFAHAYLLGTVVRALGWHAVLSPFEPSVAAELGDPVAGWLEVFRGIADGTTRLGDA